jgi:hypothetical protein
VSDDTNRSASIFALNRDDPITRNARAPEPLRRVFARQQRNWCVREHVGIDGSCWSARGWRHQKTVDSHKTMIRDGCVSEPDA